jgi:FHA domain
MTDQVLDVLKFVLLGLLYLFFARVLWAVWSEVRAPRAARNPMPASGSSPAEAATVVAERPKDPGRRMEKRPTRGHSGRVGRLVVLEPKQRRGAAFAIGGGELTIGREDSCTIVIPDDQFVSGLHARIFDHGGQPMIEDLGSTNGSFLNGNKLVGTKLLHPGDRIQIGYTVLEAQ